MKGGTIEENRKRISIFISKFLNDSVWRDKLLKKIEEIKIRRKAENK
jgi:hypothetical protein